MKLASRCSCEVRMCYQPFPWAEHVCGVGLPGAWGVHACPFQQERPPGDGTFWKPSSAPPPSPQLVSAAWHQGWVREEVVAGMLLCHPPCKAQAFSWVRAIFHHPRSDEQRQKTQILLLGCSGHLCCISGPYVSLQWLSSRTFPTWPVTQNSSLDSGDAGAELSHLHCALAMTSLGERRDGRCSFAMILPFSRTVAPVLSQTSALAPGLLLELPLMLCFK